RTQIWIQGKAKPNDRNSTNRLVVMPNFFETLGIKLRAGRVFTERDSQTAPKVVVINDTAARKYFPGENPVGQHFGQSYETSGDMDVVGVVSDTKYNSLRDDAPPTMYVPSLQQRGGLMTFQLRTAADATKTVSAVREAIRRVDPNLPILSVTTQSEQI